MWWWWWGWREDAIQERGLWLWFFESIWGYVLLVMVDNSSVYIHNTSTRTLCILRKAASDEERETRYKQSMKQFETCATNNVWDLAWGSMCEISEICTAREQRETQRSIECETVHESLGCETAGVHHFVSKSVAQTCNAQSSTVFGSLEKRRTWNSKKKTDLGAIA